MTPLLIQADSRGGIPLADNSVDLVVTSPPYFGLRDYRGDGPLGAEPDPHEYLAALDVVAADVNRVCKPEASQFWNFGDKMSGYSGAKWGHGRNLTGGSDRGESLVPVVGPRSAPTAYGIPNKSLMGLPWRFAIRRIDAGMILRAEIVWHKNAMPESVSDRVRRTHEQFFHLTQTDRYPTAIDEIRVPYMGDTGGERSSYPSGSASSMNNGQHQTKSDAGLPLHPRGRLPGSVWEINTEPLRVPDYFVQDDLGWKMMDRAELARWVEHRTGAGDWSPVEVTEIDHFAAMPQEWPRRLMVGFAPRGICLECSQGRWPDAYGEFVCPCLADEKNGKSMKIPTRPAVILDPFCGSGTTPMVAHALGHQGVGLDLSFDYLRLSRWRCHPSSGQAAKTIERTWGERQQSLI